MIVVLDKHGTYVGKTGRSLRVNLPDKQKKEFPVKDLSALILLGKVNFSYDALMLLARYGVPVLFSTRWEPKALFHPFFNHGTVITRREQIIAFNDERGLHLAKRFSYSAVANKIRLLKYLTRLKGDDSEFQEVITDAIDMMQSYKEQILGEDGHLEQVRMRIMGYEGAASQIYYSVLRYVFPEEFEYTGRNRRPPLDPVNAAFSLGYAIIYSKVLIAVSLAGLEPYAGFLHADRSGKPSLVLDLSEEFKQWIVDRTVIKMFLRNMLKPSDFIFGEGRVEFSDKAKEVYLQQLSKRLFSPIKVIDRKSTTTPFQIIMTQARKIVRYLLGKDLEYKPFIARY